MTGLLLLLFSLATGFLPGSSLEPAVPPTTLTSSFTLQYFPVTCAVPTTAVCCSESIECFPGIAYRLSLKLFVAILVARIITGIIVQFRFRIRCISIPNFCILTFFLLLLHDISVCGYYYYYHHHHHYKGVG
jgi:hypothetical protein